MITTRSIADYSQIIEQYNKDLKVLKSKKPNKDNLGEIFSVFQKIIELQTELFKAYSFRSDLYSKKGSENLAQADLTKAKEMNDDTKSLSFFLNGLKKENPSISFETPKQEKKTVFSISKEGLESIGVKFNGTGASLDNLSWSQSRIDPKKRIEFIQTLAGKIVRYHKKDETLVFVDIGSGGLLIPYLLAKSLKKLGYTQLQFRLIDPIYTEPNNNSIRNDFKKKIAEELSISVNDIKPEMVSFFSSADKYLSKKIESKSLFQNDAQNSTLFTLVINPTGGQSIEITTPLARGERVSFKDMDGTENFIEITPKNSQSDKMDDLFSHFGKNKMMTIIAEYRAGIRIFSNGKLSIVAEDILGKQKLEKFLKDNFSESDYQKCLSKSDKINYLLNLLNKEFSTSIFRCIYTSQAEVHDLLKINGNEKSKKEHFFATLSPEKEGVFETMSEFVSGQKEFASDKKEIQTNLD